MIIGIFFPSFGMLLGAFVGAVLVEWIVTRKEKRALRAGWGIFAASVPGMAMKLGTSGVMAYYFLAAAIKGLWTSNLLSLRTGRRRIPLLAPKN